MEHAFSFNNYRHTHLGLYIKIYGEVFGIFLGVNISQEIQPYIFIYCSFVFIVIKSSIPYSYDLTL